LIGLPLYAAECLALSERLSNPLDKARLIQMAQDFLSIAEKPGFSEHGWMIPALPPKQTLTPRNPMSALCQ
jgi:hypothetical protein